jgi:hypothetical protein
VSLIEFVHVGPNVTRSPVVATAYTDPRGSYQFHPDHFADYYIEVKKEGYGQSGRAVTLDQAHSTVKSAFTLRRRGSTVTGRVVDGDGQPVPDLKVVVQGAGLVLPGPPLGNDAITVTAADGTFIASDVPPGPHVVRISPRAAAKEKVELQFSAADLKIVDQDLETTYWPGGGSRPTASIPVSPGGSASAGTIKIRNVPYYRAHVSVPRVECETGEKWAVRAAYSGEVSLERPTTIPCTNYFLVKNLRPGTYSFTLGKDAPVPAKWAITSVDISTKNVEVALTFEPESQIVGRFVAAEGATLPPLDKLKVSTLGNARGPSAVPPDGEGKFVLSGLMFPSHRIAVAGLTKDYYIKELHCNGASSIDGTVTLSPGAANQVEIVIDDKPGVISGTVTDGDQPAADAEVRLYPKVPPLGVSTVTNFGNSVRADKQGKFQINELAPGEYGIAAWQPPTVRGSTGIGYSAPARRPHPILERGGTVSITVPLSDPSH